MHTIHTGAAVFALICLNCGGGGGTEVVKPRPKNDPTIAEPQETNQPEKAPFLQATGQGASDDQAYAAAVAQLESKLYSSEAWAQVLEIAVHDRTRDTVRSPENQGSDRQVVVGLSKERVAEILDAAGTRPWQPQVPEQIAEPVARAARVFFEHFLCQRRQALLQDTCPLPDLDAVRSEMQKLAKSMRLRSLYRDGVPLSTDARPLRPMVIATEFGSSGPYAPLPGIPLVAAAPGGVVLLETASAVSDNAGIARFEFIQDAVLTGEVQVSVDRVALFGPMAELWPQDQLAVTGRIVGVRHWAAIIEERARGRSVNDGLSSSKLSDAMRARGASGAFLLSPATASDLGGASDEELAGRLPGLADSWAGRVDVLLLIEVASDYASRAGAHKVLYEARGRMRVYDVWTGKLLATFDETVTASGLGEDNADRAARSRMARKLAKTLLGLKR